MENKQYEIAYDLHTHTNFSHGKGSIEDNVQAALEKKLSHIAITDHGPGHLFYGVKRQALPLMQREIDLLQAKYPKISIRLSVEANIIKSNNHLDIEPEEFSKYDFVTAGYHYGLSGASCVSNCLWSCGLKMGEKSLKMKNTDMTIKALYENDVAVLTHPGDKGPVDMLAIAEACADRNTLMEISAHHKHMTVEEIKIAAETQAQFIINSDAHTPEKVGYFQSGLDRATEAGLDLSRVINLRERI